MSGRQDREWKEAVLRAYKDFDQFMRGIKSGLIYLPHRGWVKFEDYLEYLKKVGEQRFGDP